MIKILLADDHSVVRYILKRFITDEEDMIISGEAENGEQVLNLLKENVYDLLILDLNLPDINGLQVLEKIKEANYKISVLILSVLPEEQFAISAIKAGASGYLNKLNTSEQLITAIKKVNMGGYYVSPSMTGSLSAIMRAQ